MQSSNFAGELLSLERLNSDGTYRSSLEHHSDASDATPAFGEGQDIRGARFASSNTMQRVSPNQDSAAQTPDRRAFSDNHETDHLDEDIEVTLQHREAYGAGRNMHVTWQGESADDALLSRRYTILSLSPHTTNNMPTMHRSHSTPNMSMMRNEFSTRGNVTITHNNRARDFFISRARSHIPTHSHSMPHLPLRSAPRCVSGRSTASFAIEDAETLHLISALEACIYKLMTNEHGQIVGEQHDLGCSRSRSFVSFGTFENYSQNEDAGRGRRTQHTEGSEHAQELGARQSRANGHDLNSSLTRDHDGHNHRHVPAPRAGSIARDNSTKFFTSYSGTSEASDGNILGATRRLAGAEKTMPLTKKMYKSWRKVRASIYHTLRWSKLTCFVLVWLSSLTLQEGIFEMK